MTYQTLRPLLFALPAEFAHEVGTRTLKVALSIPHACDWARDAFCVDDPALATECFGVRFSNPVGLAAGFDKSAELFNELACLGFGHVEVGTVTAHAQPGNPKPRLFRLPEDQALLNRMGFNNPGAEAVARHLAHQPINTVLGINIGKSAMTPLENAVEDYLRSLELLQPYAAYIAINVSSPNTVGLRSLQAVEPLIQLVRAVRSRATKPVLLKIAPDLTDEQVEQVVGVVTGEYLAGIIATNTTISREKLVTPAERVASLGNGGISGSPVRRRALEVVKLIHRLTRGKLPIIGVGGVFSAEDAWSMITAGASLVQLYTGFIYAGPTVVRDINRGLVSLLHRHKLRSVSQAVGMAAT